MHLILTGATGLVGSATLHAMLRNPAVTRITIFSRKPVEQASDTEDAKRKCNVLTWPDFPVAPSPAELASIRDAHGCIWALGISQAEVDAPTYERITLTWPVAWVKAFAGAGMGVSTEGQESLFNFVYVSGEGATHQPGSLTSRFARIKGQTEQTLLRFAQDETTSGLKMYCARPGGVDRRGHTEITKYVAAREGILKKLVMTFMAVVGPFWKSMMSPTPALGDALLQLGMGDGKPLPKGPGVESEGRLLRNVALRRLAGL